MIICSASNIDLIQGSLGYGDATEGINITDWRISNTQSAIAGQSGVFSIFNSSSITPNISIVDNGTVGIGTIPSISSTSKMEIVGDVNITGAYNINNRNVLNDTSNYILSTSNALVARIIASGGSGGGSLTSGGNLSLSNSATSNTILSIANSNILVYSSNYTSNVVTVSGAPFTATFADANVPSTHAQVTDTPNDRYMIFTTASVNHTFTVPAGGLNCDILMIGGGGGGWYGGGGAGACIVAINQTLPAGSCVVNVGAGGGGGQIGLDSFIKIGGSDRYRAKGGGFSGSTANINGGNGGCGGGAGYNTNTTITESEGIAVSTNVVVLTSGLTSNIGPSITSTYAVLGNAGGNNSGTNFAGSGGGIGTAGVSGGVGGNGSYQVTLTGAATPINFRSYFANGSTSFGVQDGTSTNYYIGGGGSGYNTTGWISGGLGSGADSNNNIPVANTGSGSSATSAGASGIIIIRYRSVSTTTTPTPTSTTLTTLGTPSIELIRGIAGDSNLDYKLGNYDGNFKIMSSISNTDTDRLAITSGGNLMLTNNSTNSTALSIINSNVVVAATPATTGGRIDTITTAGSPSQGTIGTTDRFMIFTANGSFTVPAGGIICDILMIGGGGAGGGGAGSAGGGGGGAGGCIVAINQSFTTTGVYNVVVGAGDVASGTTAGAGADSTIGLNGGSTLYIAKGGGRGEIGNNGRNNGGCGGGSGWNVVKTGGLAVNTNMVAGTLVDANARSATFAVFGNKGGDRPDSTSGVTGVGGGGIGGAGGNHIVSSINAGPGGVGLFQATVGGTTYNFRSYFANNGNPYNFGALNSVDSQYYIGGGGGGSVQTCTKEAGPNVGGLGGVGGGGNGGITTTFNPSTGASAGAVNAVAGTANTGGGGGGGYYSGVNGGNGGSGIVIIRYRVAPVTIGVPSMELIRGIAGDSNHDYKVGNYNGDFKIMSAVSGTADVERLNISSVGNVGIGTSSPANELHVFDNTTSATSLIIQNNNQIVTSNITQGTSTSNSTVTSAGTTTSTITLTFTNGGPSVHEAVTDSTTEKIMIFRDASVYHTFTVPTGDINCDVLMIGGGGGGGWGYGNASGAGACIVSINQKLPAGSCVVHVGNGGDPPSTGDGTNGADSFIRVANSDRYRAKGGGYAVNLYTGNGANGGCGGSVNSSGSGGQPVSTNVVTLNDGTTTTTPPSLDYTHRYAVMGNAGYGGTTNYGGGGGIGDAGLANRGGNGKYNVYIDGTTYNFRDYFANGGNSFGVLHTDTKYYIGGGGAWSTGSGGLGGGGGGGGSPVANTGSGTRSTQGASGIVIIRYRSQITTNTTVTTTTYTHTPTITTTLSTPTLGTPSIELVRGTQGDSNRDYKIGNYEGDFIVKSSVSNTDTDYIRILGTDGTIYNKPNSLYWNQTSDRRIKENIMRASYDMCYNNIDKLELNRFNYIKEFNTGNKDTNQLGFIAQEIKEIFPKAVFTNNYNSVDLNIQDMLSIDIGQINFTLYGAVKKLMEINKDKELRLKRLECLLNVEDSGSEAVVDNMVIDSDVLIDSSNLLYTSNIILDTSNIAIDTSNIILDSSNIAIDTSNIILDSSNI